MQERIVFMGSPEFAVPVLRRLANHYPVAGVVTQPDRPAGRGRTLTPPPIRTLCDELHLPVIQPRRLSEPDAFQQLEHWAPQVIVVAAFGQILRPPVLDLPKFGCVNVHASLLPRWRGAAPIQAAIMSGDAVTGITIMRMDPGIDTGPVLKQSMLTITSEDTAASLSARLSDLGAELLLDTLPEYLAGTLIPRAQTDTLATYAPMIHKDAGRLDFSRSAIELERQVRAYNPWPGAFTTWDNQVLKVHRAHAVEESTAQPGTHAIHQGLPAVATGQGMLVLDQLQLAGRNAQPGKAFLNGVRDWNA